MRRIKIIINEEIGQAIKKLDDLLDKANEDNIGELKSSLKLDYSRFVSQWNQCDKMKQGSYEELENIAKEKIEKK